MKKRLGKVFTQPFIFLVSVECFFYKYLINQSPKYFKYIEVAYHLYKLGQLTRHLSIHYLYKRQLLDQE